MESSGLTFSGKFKIAHRRNGVLIEEFEIPNGVTNVGRTNALDVYFRQQTQPTFYLGLIDNAGFSAVSSADTISSHAGWTESTAYAAATRPAWSPDAASSQSISNGTGVTFAINATVTIYGFFVVSNSTKGGTTGTLWSTAAFGSPRNYINGDTLTASYTVTD